MVHRVQRDDHGPVLPRRDSEDGGSLSNGMHDSTEHFAPPFFSAVMECGSEGNAYELHRLVGGMQAAAVQPVCFVGHGLLVLHPAEPVAAPR